MRILIFGIIVYAVYLLLRIFFKMLANQKSAPGAPPVKNTEKKPRKVDLSNVEDADFEEIKKD